MPRIDPCDLLKCLNVLLSPQGGIKSEDEVKRICSLMEKFSKKLVSKCVYLCILKASEIHLLSMFMGSGGWNLISNWLELAMLAQNHPFLIELLEVILLCPVDIERLKSNTMPRQIKALSKDSNTHPRVRELAGDIVKLWLTIVKSAPSLNVAAVLPVPTVQSLEPVLEPVQPAVEPPTKRRRESDEDNVENGLAAADSGSMSNTSDNSSDGGEIFVKRKAPKVITRKAIRENASLRSRLVVDEDSKATPRLKILKKRQNERRRRGEESSDDEDMVEKRKRKEEKERKEAEKFARFKQERDKREGKTKKKSADPKAKPDEKTKSSKSSSIEDKPKNDKSKNDKSANDKSKSNGKLNSELAKLVPKSIEKLGRIPRIARDDNAKLSSPKDDTKKKSDDLKSKPSDDSKRKPSDDRKRPEETKKDKKKEEKKREEKPVTKKQVSMSVERRPASEPRPKTVKTYGSRFRLTGLEEEAPPPPRKTTVDRKTTKRPTNAVEAPGKKLRSFDDNDKGRINTPYLQDSDMFMNAIDVAVELQKEVRKRKKPVDKPVVTSPVTKKPEVSSPSELKQIPDHNEHKPFKFYNETLETTIEENDDPVLNKEKLTSDAEKSPKESEEKMDWSKCPKTDGLKSALSYFRSKSKPKKSVTWKSEIELESIQYFEVDATERTNVVRNFWDMQMKERTNERESLQLVRKIAENDKMAEKTKWAKLILVEITNATSAVPGSNSEEKNIQYARERTVAPAIYYNKLMIPDSPAEPDLEYHPVSTPIPIIPTEDISGATGTVYDFSTTKWPEPKTPSEPSSPANVSPTTAVTNATYSVPPPTFVPPPANPDPNFAPPPFPPPFFPGPMPGTNWAPPFDGSATMVPPPDMMPPPFAIMQPPFPPMPGQLPPWGFPPHTPMQTSPQPEQVHPNNSYTWRGDGYNRSWKGNNNNDRGNWNNIRVNTRKKCKYYEARGSCTISGCRFYHGD